MNFVIWREYNSVAYDDGYVISSSIKEIVNLIIDF